MPTADWANAAKPKKTELFSCSAFLLASGSSGSNRGVYKSCDWAVATVVCDRRVSGESSQPEISSRRNISDSAIYHDDSAIIDAVTQNAMGLRSLDSHTVFFAYLSKLEKRVFLILQMSIRELNLTR